MEPAIEPANFSLAGKNALVTGAGRGIGRALAIGLARAGARVTVTARNEITAQQVCSQIREFGGQADSACLDVSGTDTIQPVLTRCADLMGGLDILINNAGVEQVCDSLSVDEALWEKIVGTNLKGAFFCAQAAGKLMTAQQKGSIINLCSLTSFVGVPTATPYTSSKSGLLGMTKALASEWAGSSVRVNAIAPGYFRTQLTEVFYEDESWTKSMQEKIPMGRFGEMKDLVGTAVFLCSDAAQYITGQVIAVDGGYLASI